MLLSFFGEVQVDGEVVCFISRRDRVYLAPPELIGGPGVLPNTGGKQVLKRDRKIGCTGNGGGSSY